MSQFLPLQEFFLTHASISYFNIAWSWLSNHGIFLCQPKVLLIVFYINNGKLATHISYNSRCKSRSSLDLNNACYITVTPHRPSIYLSSINHEPSILTMRQDGQKTKNNKENVHLTTKTTTQYRIKTVWCSISTQHLGGWP